MSNTNLLAIANETFNLHHRLGVLNTAVEMSKVEGIPASKVKKLQQERSKLTKKINANESQILSRMTLSSNIQITSKEPWVFVRYQDDQSLDNKLALIPVLDGCLSSLLVDGRESSQMSFSEFNCIKPLVLDSKAANAMEEQAVPEAIEELKALGCTLNKVLATAPKTVVLMSLVTEPEKKDEVSQETLPQPVSESVDLIVSAHSGKRWAQRVLGVSDDTRAELYFRSNAESIRKDVLNAVSKAEKVWRDEADAIDYLLDENNLIYVIGHDQAIPTIITLYELDFGFVKDINRTITLGQIEVLKNYHAMWLETESLVNTERAEAMDTSASIDEDIALLEAQLRAKKAEKKAIEADIDKMNSTVTLAEQVFTKEHSKLFKKWRTMEGM